MDLAVPSAMTITGKQKAAMLLMSLDIATATELLKGLNPKAVQELAIELSYLDAAGLRNSKQSADVARHFYRSLQSKPEFQLKNFLAEMLKNTVGQEKAAEIQTQIQDLLVKRDPFLAIRSADFHALAPVLENEHPQAVAVVLSELPAKKSSEILGLLGEGMRLSAISRMTRVETVTAEAKARIAEMVSKRIETISAARGKSTAQIQPQPEQSLRKVAIILRNLGKDLRDGLLSAVQEKDAQIGEKVSNLMIVWDDVPQVADRSLQEALRGIEERQLALALHKADDTIIQKIKSNISERAAAMVDEEASLMAAPKKDDIEQARERIVSTLREMNNKGELMFIEE
jgi:flagellar motor switch protein FliG